MVTDYTVIRKKGLIVKLSQDEKSSRVLKIFLLLDSVYWFVKWVWDRLDDAKSFQYRHCELWGPGLLLKLCLQEGQPVTTRIWPKRY